MFVGCCAQSSLTSPSRWASPQRRRRRFPFKAPTMVSDSFVDRAAELARRREMDHAGRQADRSTRKLAASDNRQRGPRAPKTASRFHFNKKYSNRAKAHRAPSSAVVKLKYDFRLDRPEGGRNDLDFVYVCGPDGIPESALDPIQMAFASEDALGRKANLKARIMGHDTIALPADLIKSQRHELVRNLADHYQKTLGVPVYCAAHLPDSGNRNYHLHLSHPLRNVHDDGKGGFRLGEKILFEQRPNVRKEAGLSPTNHNDLKNLRMNVANIIADSMSDAGLDCQQSERWRHGHLRLSQQLQEASKRGDTQFIDDNFGRDPTRHEGPNTAEWSVRPNDPKRVAAITHNRDVAMYEAGPELITRTLLNRVLDQSKKISITDPEQFRMLARDHGLSIHWIRKKGDKTAPVSGVQYQIVGGPKIAGKQVGASIGDLKRRFGWAESPAYHRYPARTGPEFEKYSQCILDAGLSITPGTPKDLLPNAIAVIHQEAERLKTQAVQSFPRVVAAAGDAANPQQNFHHLESEQMKEIHRPDQSDGEQLAKSAGIVATAASAAKFIPGAAPVAWTVEVAARATQAAVKIDQASGGAASKLSPMAGIRGIGGARPAARTPAGQTHQYRPGPRPRS